MLSFPEKAHAQHKSPSTSLRALSYAAHLFKVSGSGLTAPANAAIASPPLLLVILLSAGLIWRKLHARLLLPFYS